MTHGTETTEIPDDIRGGLDRAAQRGSVDRVVRKLTEEEHNIYAGACVRAVSIIPAFRDAISLLSPFYDSTASTAYTDRHARVGLSPWFFQSLNNRQRASAILHECMHVLNNHFSRGDRLIGENRNNLMNQVFNIAGDFEINCGLDELPSVDISFGVLPDKGKYGLERHKTMEQYVPALTKQLDDSDPNCPDCQEEKKQQQSSQDKGDSDDSQSGQNSGSESGDDSDYGKGSGNGDANGSDSSDGGSGDTGSSEAGNGGNQSVSSGSSSSSGSSFGDNSGGGSSSGQGSQGGSQPSGSGSTQGGDQIGQKCPKHSQNGSQGSPNQFGEDGSPGQRGDNGGSCDIPTSERGEAADEAGIEKASSASQSIAQRNTMVRMEEEMRKNKGRPGFDEMNNFLNTSMLKMVKPKVPWQSTLRRVIGKANSAIARGGSQTSHRKVNRRFTQSEFIFPGMIHYVPRAMMGIDTSGSMGGEDYLVTLSEAGGIIKACSRGKDSVSFFAVDTAVKKVTPVRKVDDIKLTGGGGTDMSVAIRYFAEIPLKVRPEVFILATDGYTEWGSYEKVLNGIKAPFHHIIMVTNRGGYDTVPMSLRKHPWVTVIDISDGTE